MVSIEQDLRVIANTAEQVRVSAGPWPGVESAKVHVTGVLKRDLSRRDGHWYVKCGEGGVAMFSTDDVVGMTFNTHKPTVIYVK